ncbi:MAG: bifunctional precorrin-2 dehydrogenase/sirohydrochlorin ferrochelatase [Actinomycetota bacterium]
MSTPAAGLTVTVPVAGQPVVVVGGGAVASRRVATLVDHGARVGVIAPTVTPELAARAAAGEIEVRARPFVPVDADGARLVFAATDDPDVNAEVRVRARAAGAWANRADDPDDCDFTVLPAVRRGDLVVAVGTGGRSPALAAYLRRRFAEELEGFEAVLELLAEARVETRAEGGSSDDIDWRRAFDEGIVDLVRSGRIDRARELLSRCR